MAIKNIIFDLGGVIININYHLTSQVFQRYGVYNFDSIYSQREQVALFDDFETGRISSQEFREALRQLLQIKISDQELDDAWVSMLLDLPEERLQFIQSLRDANYRTFLFSNINAIHFTKLLKMRGLAQSTNLFTGLFEREYYSHLFGKRKPHPESFAAILHEQQLIPEQTLFIDDSIQHVQGAQQAGIHGLHLTSGKTILDLPQLVTLAL